MRLTTGLRSRGLAVAFIFSISLLAFLCAHAHAQQPAVKEEAEAPAGAPQEVVTQIVKLAPEIARITAFTGEVLVRNRMEWVQVTEVGHALFSGDKVVTKRGRAEVTFDDGSVIRLGLDASVKITEKAEVKGLLFRRKLSMRNIRVALGKVWFDIKAAKGKTTTMETPTMSAGVRGTSGVVSADSEGESEWGLTEGEADTSGAFSQPASYEAPDTNVMPTELPESDPAYEATAISRAADEAIRAREMVVELRDKAAQLEDRARGLEMRAQAEPTVHNRMVASQARLEANRAKLEAALSGVGSKGISTREAVEEALTMREEKNAQRTLEVVQQVEGFLDAVQAEQEKGVLAETLTQGRSDEHLLKGGMAFSNSVAKAAKVCEYAAWAFSNVGNATSEGDGAGEAGALHYAERARAYSDRSQSMTSRGQDMVREVASARESMIRRSLHAAMSPMYVAQGNLLERTMGLVEALVGLDMALEALVGASGFVALGASSMAGGFITDDLEDFIDAFGQAAEDAADAGDDAADAAQAGDMAALEAALGRLQAALHQMEVFLAIATALDDPSAVYAVLHDLIRQLIAQIVTEVVPELVEWEGGPGLPDSFYDECVRNADCLAAMLGCGDDVACLAALAEQVAGTVGPEGEEEGPPEEVTPPEEEEEEPEEVAGEDGEDGEEPPPPPPPPPRRPPEVVVIEGPDTPSDGYTKVELGITPTFDFYGEDEPNAWLMYNGLIQFGDPLYKPNPTPEEIAGLVLVPDQEGGLPAIVPLGGNLDIGAGGSLTITSFLDQIYAWLPGVEPDDPDALLSVRDEVIFTYFNIPSDGIPDSSNIFRTILVGPLPDGGRAIGDELSVRLDYQRVDRPGGALPEDDFQHAVVGIFPASPEVAATQLGPEIDFTELFLASEYGNPLYTVEPGEAVYEEFGVGASVTTEAHDFAGWGGHGTFSGGPFTLENVTNLHGLFNPVNPAYPFNMEGPWVMGTLSGLTMEGELSGAPVTLSFTPSEFTLEGIGAIKQGTYAYTPAGELGNHFTGTGGTLWLHFPDSSDFVTVDIPASTLGIVSGGTVGAGWDFNTGKVEGDVISGIFTSPDGLSQVLEVTPGSSQGTFSLSGMVTDPFSVPYAANGTYMFTHDLPWYTTQSTGELMLTFDEISENLWFDLDMAQIEVGEYGLLTFQGGAQVGPNLFGTFTPPGSPEVVLFPTAQGVGTFYIGESGVPSYTGTYAFGQNPGDVGGTLSLYFDPFGELLQFEIDTSTIPDGYSATLLFSRPGGLAVGVGGTFTSDGADIFLDNVDRFSMHNVVLDPITGNPIELETGEPVMGTYTFTADPLAVPPGGTLAFTFDRISANPTITMDASSPALGPGPDVLVFVPDLSSPTPGARVEDVLFGDFEGQPSGREGLSLIPTARGSSVTGTFALAGLVDSPASPGVKLTAEGVYRYDGSEVIGGDPSVLEMVFSNVSDYFTFTLDDLFLNALTGQIFTADVFFEPLTTPSSKHGRIIGGLLDRQFMGTGTIMRADDVLTLPLKLDFDAKWGEFKLTGSTSAPHPIHVTEDGTYFFDMGDFVGDWGDTGFGFVDPSLSLFGEASGTGLPIWTAAIDPYVGTLHLSGSSITVNETPLTIETWLEEGGELVSLEISTEVLAERLQLRAGLDIRAFIAGSPLGGIPLNMDVDVFDLLSEEMLAELQEVAGADEVVGVSIIFRPINGDPANGYDIYIDYITDPIEAVPTQDPPAIVAQEPEASPHTVSGNSY